MMTSVLDSKGVDQCLVLGLRRMYFYLSTYCFILQVFELS